MNWNHIFKYLSFGFLLSIHACSALIGSVVLYDQPNIESGIVDQIDEDELIIQEASFFQTSEGIDWYVIQPETPRNHSINGYIPTTALDEGGNITLGTAVYEGSNENSSILGYINSGDDCTIHAASDWLEVTVEKASQPLYFYKSKNHNEATDSDPLAVKSRIDFSTLPETQEDLVDPENHESLLPVPVVENNTDAASAPSSDVTASSLTEAAETIEAINAQSTDHSAASIIHEVVEYNFPDPDFNNKPTQMSWVEDEIKDQNVLILKDKHLKFKFAKPTSAPTTKAEPKASMPLCYLEGTLKNNPGGPFSAFKKLSAPYFLCTADGKVIAYAKPENESVKAALQQACFQNVTLEGACKLVDPKKPVLIEVQKVHFKSQL